MFIKKIVLGNLKGFVEMIMFFNFVGVSCLRVCLIDELCEGVCVFNYLIKLIMIGNL